MMRQKGAHEFDERGMMTAGVVVRILLLPGHVKDACRRVEYLFKTYGDAIFISLLSQFTPMSSLERYPELNRKVTRREYNRLVDYAVSLGVKKGFVQEGEAASESFIPDFV